MATRSEGPSALPEMTRRTSLGDSKLSSYPTFSKQHSREAVRPVKEVDKQTPAAGAAADSARGIRSDRTASGRRPSPRASNHRARRPPTPPSTVDEADIKRTKSANAGQRSPRNDPVISPRRSADPMIRKFTTRSDATSPRKVSFRGESRDVPVRPRSRDRPSRTSSSSTLKHEDRPSQNLNTSRSSHDLHGRQQTVRTPTSGRASASTETSARRTTPTERTASSAHARSHWTESQPKFSSHADGQITPPQEESLSADGSQLEDIPRVDYLLQNGGLPQTIPRGFIPRLKATSVYPYQNYSPLSSSETTSVYDARHVLAPVRRRLEDYMQVLAKNGSFAVATGYKSVARRLLDRLEHVFNRNISAERCHCVMCKSSARPEIPEAEDFGLSWGEILEIVSGRKELPTWPPFVFDAATGFIELTSNLAQPMQQLDPDVPEEYRRHYMRQNDKTKRSVQNWLAGQTVDSQSTVPRDVDDETLAFAMLTRLPPEVRPLFSALMKCQTSLENDGGTHNDTILDRTGLALQRLYRLNSPPRKPECTIFLLNNPDLHGMLATLAAISAGEWAILISGRFDGFLWSGAEQQTPMSFAQEPYPPVAPAGRSTPLSTARPQAFSPIPRGTTPFSAPSTTTAAAQGGPVQHDEATELAILAETEGAIYRDMELLEDAFEALHLRAEAVRAHIRTRAAGLRAAAQARVVPPAASESPVPPSDIGLDDASELAPDDSASNVNFARRSARKAERRRDTGTAADARRRR